jgi:hypothetical protein
VNDGELVLSIRTVRMAVDGTGLSMGRPSGMGHSGSVQGSLVELDLGAFEELAQRRDLADLFEHEDFIFLVAVNLETCKPTRVSVP